MEGVDPEYLAALPPELQAEVLEQQRSQRRQARAVSLAHISSRTTNAALQRQPPGSPAARAAGGGARAAAQPAQTGPCGKPCFFLCVLRL